MPEAQQDPGSTYDESGRRKFTVPGIIDANGNLRCSQCGCTDLRVTNTYNWEAGGKKRRRACRNCGWSAKTVEVPLQE